MIMLVMFEIFSKFKNSVEAMKYLLQILGNITLRKWDTIFAGIIRSRQQLYNHVLLQWRVKSLVTYIHVH